MHIYHFFAETVPEGVTIDGIFESRYGIHNNKDYQDLKNTICEKYDVPLGAVKIRSLTILNR